MFFLLYFIESTVSGPPPTKCAWTTAIGVPSSALENLSESTANCVVWIASSESALRPSEAFAWLARKLVAAPWTDWMSAACVTWFGWLHVGGFGYWAYSG